jgi:RNA polymerase sigma factor (sigma-70 family)
MTSTRAERLQGEVRDLLAEHALAEWPDCRLLERFVRYRDEAAFAALLDRHGPTVLRVCRAVLREAHDAEDAFQATFLVLACSAAKVRDGAALGSFLHGTAYRVAVRARARAARRAASEKEAALMRAEAVGPEPGRHDVEAALHEEVSRLPERPRRVFVLCHLEGKTHAQAAAELGCPPGSVSRHLRRACELLRERLGARGVLAPAALLGAASARGAVPAALAQATLRAVGQHVAWATLVGGSSAPAVTLAHEVLRAMTTYKLKGLLVLLLLIALAAGGAALFARPGAAPAVLPPLPQPDQPTPETGAPAPALDRHGDALPPGAVARLGTVRLRHGGDVLALAFSRDGQALASVGDDRTLRLWQVPGGQECGRVSGQQNYVNAAAFSRDGKLLATVDAAGSLSLYEFRPAGGERRRAEVGPRRLQFKPEAGTVRFLAFLPDGSLVSGAVDGRVYLWDATTGKELRRFGNPADDKVHSFALSPDGKKLAVGCRDSDAVLWDVSAGEKLCALPGHAKVHSFAFSPDGRTLATGDESNTIRLWDLETRQVTARLVGVKAPHQPGGMGDAIHALTFAPDGKTLVSAGDYGDGTVRVWDVRAGTERRQLKGQHGDGGLLALSSDGRTLAVAGANHTVRLWDVTTGKELDGDLGSQGSVRAVAVAPDGARVAAAGSDGVIRLWDRATGREIRSFRAHRQRVSALAFLPDGKRLVSSGEYDAARLWEVATGKELRSFAGAEDNTRGVTHVCCPADADKLALTTYLPSVHLVDVESSQVKHSLKGRLCSRVAFSPDGKLLAGGGDDPLLSVWDAATGEEKWSAKPGGPVVAVAFAPDGRAVAAGVYGKGVVLWDAATGREVRHLPFGNGAVRAVAISPDSRLLAAGGDTNEVTLYELATGQAVQRLPGHAGFVWSLTFAPDGRSLVTGSWDATALVWDLSGRELAQKQRGPLTDAELTARWDALSRAESADAYPAVLSLANAPKQSVAYLRARVAADKLPDPKVIARWLADLDDEEFEVRETASRELARLGKAAEAELRRARAAPPSTEVRRRLDELLDKLGAGAAESVRWQRVVAVLELAGTAEARELLEQLATKAAGEDVRRQAKGALDRLAKRP